MGQDDMKKCPYCAELIKREAIKCRYCGSILTEKKNGFDFLSTPGYWHRVNDGKKIAGVCTGIAQQLDAPMLILPLRLFFILTTFFWGFGFILYIILWALMAPPTDSGSMSATGAYPGYTQPKGSSIITPPPPSTDSVDDDFDYVEGSTPPPEEFRPEANSTSEPEENSGDASGDTTIQKRMLFLGMFAILTICIYVAGSLYIAVLSNLSLSFSVQLTIAILGISTLFAAYKRASAKQYTPVAVASE